MQEEFETPIVECPKCGAPHEDHDGFGVVYCSICGYCQHLSSSDDICDYCGKSTAPAPLPCRDPAAIDAELILTARLYIVASKAGIHEATLLTIFAKVAALAWVLHPELNEVGAQGWAWELIAGIKDEEGGA